MPAITEERCRACSILGGVTVETETEAAEYRRLLAPQIPPGDDLAAPPCVPPWKLAEIEKRTGRPCPRRELTDPDNYLVAELCNLSIPEHTRHLVQPWLSARIPSRARRVRLLSRLAKTLRAPQVIEHMFPSTSSRR